MACLFLSVLLSGCCVKAEGEQSNTKMVVISNDVVEWERRHISEVLGRTGGPDFMLD